MTNSTESKNDVEWGYKWYWTKAIFLGSSWTQIFAMFPTTSHGEKKIYDIKIYEISYNKKN